jgi:hypothetical protein
MRIAHMNMPARRLGLVVLLVVSEMGCTTWIADHQGAPTGENSEGFSSTGEQPNATSGSMTGVPTSSSSSTMDGSLSSTGYHDPMTTVPGTIPDPSAVSLTMNEEASNPDPDTSNGEDISAAETSSSIGTMETSGDAEESAGPDCDIDDENSAVRWGDNCILRKDVRFMFVTSDRHYGNFGGRIAADQICMERAAKGVGAHRLEGEFKAWLSVDGEDADSVLEAFDGPYVKYDPYETDNSVVVVSPKDGQGLVSPINVTEDAALVESERRAWTGTAPDGKGTGSNCSNWTVLTNSGTTGRTANYNGGWTNYEGSLCVNQKRLYCIQQGPIP